MSKNGFINTGFEILKSSLKSLIYPEGQLSPNYTPTYPIIPSEYTTEDFQNSDVWRFFGSQAFEVDIPLCFDTFDNQIVAFKRCPPLSTVIKRKATADLNGKRYVMNTRGKEATTAYAEAIKKKLKKPNLLQNWRNFRAQQKIYIQTHGFCVMFATYSTGYESGLLTESTNIWNVPPGLLDIKLTGKLYWQNDIKEIIEYVKIGKTVLPLDNIYIFRDSGATSFTKGIFPDSRIMDLQMPISNVICALNSRNTLIRRRGALGVLSPRAKDGTGAITIPLKDSEKKELQREWRRYGTTSDQENILISNAAVDWTRISMDVGELKLMEEVQDSSMMICDAYGFPPHLMGLLDPTFNNQNTAEKGLYQNTIIPEAENDDATYNDAFKTEENNLKILTDFEYLPILQEGADKKATARYTLDNALEKEFKNNLITKNRWLELLGEDTIGPEGDKYYSDLIKLGLAFGTSSASGGLNVNSNGELTSATNGQSNGTT